MSNYSPQGTEDAWRGPNSVPTKLSSRALRRIHPGQSLTPGPSVSFWRVSEDLGAPYPRCSRCRRPLRGVYAPPKSIEVPLQPGTGGSGR